MIKYLSVFILAIFFIACSNNRQPKEESTNVQEAEEPYVDPDQQKLTTVFSDIYRQFAQQDSSFNPGRFELAGDDSLTTPPLAETKQLLAYYPYFIYNKDSSYAIDLYSYNVLLIKRNGKTLVTESGPDTEVGLVNLKNKTRQRIYFGGSSSTVLDAKWSGNNELFLMTGELIGNDKFQPAILKYNTDSKIVRHFVYPDSLHLKPVDYKQRELKNL